VPLSFEGDSHEGMSHKLYRAIGSRDETIIVEVSHETLTDKGEERVLQKASDKYDAGEVTADGKVTVLSSDFE
jgi:hypothetical protein